MKKTLLSFLLVALALTNVNAQTTYSQYDVNHDGEEDVADVSYLIQYLLNRKNGGDSGTDATLLSGKFSVSDKKKVQFTRGNLYWDGSSYQLEQSQLGFPREWNTSHVGHFYWSNSTDAVTSGKEPYAQEYAYSSRSKDDEFFATNMTVDGESELRVLTSAEWDYLLNHDGADNSRKGKYKYPVKVGDISNCILIAPDNYSGTLNSTYTLSEWKTAKEDGLVCLPDVGYRNGADIDQSIGSYNYWSSSSTAAAIATSVYVNNGTLSSSATICDRSDGCAVRLVKEVSTSGTTDGHEWVDLGLPSGTLWAKMNIGADTETAAGLYFAWGETTGYAKGAGHTFSWANYTLCNGAINTFSRYCTSSDQGTVDGNTELLAADDAATVNWGSNWQIPSYAQQDELRASCTWTWDSTNKGYKVTGTNGNFIFLPAAGYGSESSFSGVNSTGYYWSRSLFFNGDNIAYGLYYTSSLQGYSMSYRCSGLTIRPVRK